MAITLDGPLYVLEGDTAQYSVRQALGDLLAGETLTFDLASAGEADAGSDYYALTPTDFISDIVGLAVNITVLGGVATVSITNSTGASIPSGTTLIRFGLTSIADPFLGGDSVTVSIDPTTASTRIVNSAVSTDISSVIRRSISASDWEALAGDAHRYAGIAGIAPSLAINVQTGNQDNTILLDDGIAFASLDTGAGNDLISILVQPISDRLFNLENNLLDYVQFGHGAYQAFISTGDGRDVVNVQSADGAGNIDYVRESPQDTPGYLRPDYYQSVVDVGRGDDYVYAFLPYQSTFLGGDGVDIIFFYGRFLDWSYELVDVGADGLDIVRSDNAADQSVWTVGENVSSTARQNVVRGFEFVQFNDILLDVREALALVGPSSVVEGSTTNYAIALAGDGLLSGQTVTFTLELIGIVARKDLDFAALAESALIGSNGITLQVLDFDENTGAITSIATANRDFASGETIATVTISTLQDLVVESPESFALGLRGFFDEQSVMTTITDNDESVITLTGPSTVAEGAITSAYSVELSTAGLGVDQSITFTIDLISETSEEGLDFESLNTVRLVPASGIVLSSVVYSPDGSVTVTAENRSLSELTVGAQLLSFVVRTIDNDTQQVSQSTVGTSPAFGGGTYLVGVDITSGTYRGELSGAVPYWQISSDANGSDIIANALPSGPFIINVEDGQYLTLQDVEIRADSLSSVSLDAPAQPGSFSVVLTSPVNVLNSEVSTLIIDDEVSVTASTSDGGLVIAAAASAGAVGIIGTPNSDVVTGNNFANQIYGDTGSDVMTGLLGADIFRFRLADGLSQGDQITDFNPLEDKIQLADVSRASALGKLFKGKAEISAKAFAKAFGVVNSSALAETSKKQLVYDRFSGGLFYNEDGKKSGFGLGGQIAALPSLLNLNSTDISLLYTDQPF